MHLRDYMKVNVWLLPMVIIFLFLLIWIFGNNYFTTPGKYPYVRLDDGWTIHHGDIYFNDADLDETNIGTTYKGEDVTASHLIPDVYIPSGCLMFKSVLSSVTVRIDGEIVYEYGQDYEAKGRLVPKQYNYVPITRDQLGKNMVITFHITEDNAITGISTVYYGNRQELYIAFMQSKRLDTFIGIFLCLFGFLLLTLSSYLYMYHGKDLSLIFSSLISFVLGSYSMAFNDVFCFITDNNVFTTFLEYITLYSVPFAIISFLISTHPKLNKNLSNVTTAVNVLFPLTTVVLHLTGAVHINAFVATLHVIAVTEALIFIPSIIIDVIHEYKEYKHSPELSALTSDSILIIGLVLFMICSVIDILKYNVMKTFGSGGEAHTDIGFMTIGALCFVLCLFMFYFYQGIEHINAAYMKEQLEGLAYTDALTGLMNRAKCMQYMASVQGKFAIISLDMDNLKPVNDSLGHLAGDKMIHDFADLLKLSFVGAQLIGRTGGDEFLIAVENPAPGVCEKMIRDLEVRMDDFNKNNSKINLSASCGLAYSHEVSSRSAADVFNLADSRMYEIKEKHHSQKLNRIVTDLLADKILGKGGADNA